MEADTLQEGLLGLRFDPEDAPKCQWTGISSQKTVVSIPIAWICLFLFHHYM
jgi:hypothetical protein